MRVVTEAAAATENEREEVDDVAEIVGRLGVRDREEMTNKGVSRRAPRVRAVQV